MARLKWLIKKSIKAIVPYGVLRIYKFIVTKTLKNEKPQSKLCSIEDLSLKSKGCPDFWNLIPVVITDEDTNKEDPLGEYNEVRRLLIDRHKSQYPQKNIHFGTFTYGDPIIHIWNEKIECKIGKFCSIAGNVQIMLGGEHSVEWITTYPFSAFLHYYENTMGEFLRSGNDIIIGNDVWIGGDVKIMSGVVIGDGCVIGANSVVTRNKKIPDYSIWAGVPAKEIGKRFSDKTIEKLQEIQWWNWSDDDICNVIPILQNNDVRKLIEYYEEHKYGKKNGT
ncbi:hypothetical protein FACS1894172_18120 [Spirochaetia bacterium]|nr:hypothetical protein FACS1894172_18120 [Spirochaetia bacterium]